MPGPPATVVALVPRLHRLRQPTLARGNHVGFLGAVSVPNGQTPAADIEVTASGGDPVALNCWRLARRCRSAPVTGLGRGHTPS